MRYAFFFRKWYTERADKTLTEGVGAQKFFVFFFVRFASDARHVSVKLKGRGRKTQTTKNTSVCKRCSIASVRTGRIRK